MLVAILLQEPGFDEFTAKLQVAEECWISPVNLWETRVRLHNEIGANEAIDAILETYQVKVESVSENQGHAAYLAFARYGGRPARLNLGDCFAYALAKEKALPLLFKGGDFAATDIAAA